MDTHAQHPLWGGSNVRTERPTSKGTSGLILFVWLMIGAADPATHRGILFLWWMR